MRGLTLGPPRLSVVAGRSAPRRVYPIAVDVQGTYERTLGAADRGGSQAGTSGRTIIGPPPGNTRVRRSLRTASPATTNRLYR